MKLLRVTWLAIFLADLMDGAINKFYRVIVYTSMSGELKYNC